MLLELVDGGAPVLPAAGSIGAQEVLPDECLPVGGLHRRRFLEAVEVRGGSRALAARTATAITAMPPATAAPRLSRILAAGIFETRAYRAPGGHAGEEQQESGALALVGPGGGCGRPVYELGPGFEDGDRESGARPAQATAESRDCAAGSSRSLAAGCCAARGGADGRAAGRVLRLERRIGVLGRQRRDSLSRVRPRRHLPRRLRGHGRGDPPVRRSGLDRRNGRRHRGGRRPRRRRRLLCVARSKRAAVVSAKGRDPPRLPARVLERAGNPRRDRRAVPLAAGGGRGAHGLAVGALPVVGASIYQEAERASRGYGRSAARGCQILGSLRAAGHGPPDPAWNPFSRDFREAAPAQVRHRLAKTEEGAALELLLAQLQTERVRTQQGGSDGVGAAGDRTPREGDEPGATGSAVNSVLDGGDPGGVLLLAGLGGIAAAGAGAVWARRRRYAAAPRGR
jgi:hypothetical protein